MAVCFQFGLLGCNAM